MLINWLINSSVYLFINYFIYLIIKYSNKLKATGIEPFIAELLRTQLKISENINTFW